MKFQGRRTNRRRKLHRRMRAPTTSWLIEAPNVMKFIPEDDIGNVAQTSRYMYEMAKEFGSWRLRVGSLQQLRTLIDKGYSYKDIRFSNRFNDVLSPGDLPDDVEKLIFNDNYSQPIGPGVLPSRLKSLQLPLFYDAPIEPGVLPNTLEELDLGNRFNAYLAPGVLPSSLRYLKMPDYYEHPLTPGSIPEGLHTLHLHVFELPGLVSGSFPSSLKVLSVSGSVRLIRDVLPDGLETLVIGDDYEQEIVRGVLPRGLQTLVIGEGFDYPVDPGVLPPNLKYLEFGLHFAQPLVDGALPEGLETLFFDGMHMTDSRNKVNFEYLELPTTLTRLYMNGREVNLNGTISNVRGTKFPEILRDLEL